jgi:succinoglycan biosynthesis protein ExoA
MTILKHHARPKLRQVVPVLIGPVVAMSLLYPVASFLALPALVWAAASLAYGVTLGVRDRSGCVCGSGFAAMLMHLGFSVGFIWQIAKQISFGGSRQKFGAQMGAH